MQNIISNFSQNGRDRLVASYSATPALAPVIGLFLETDPAGTRMVYSVYEYTTGGVIWWQQTFIASLSVCILLHLIQRFSFP